MLPGGVKICSDSVFIFIDLDILSENLVFSYFLNQLTIRRYTGPSNKNTIIPFLRKSLYQLFQLVRPHLPRVNDSLKAAVQPLWSPPGAEM